MLCCLDSIHTESLNARHSDRHPVDPSTSHLLPPQLYLTRPSSNSQILITSEDTGHAINDYQSATNRPPLQSTTSLFEPLWTGCGTRRTEVEFRSIVARRLCIIYGASIRPPVHGTLKSEARRYIVMERRIMDKFPGTLALFTLSAYLSTCK